jgi:hypothetical protein
MVGIQHAVGRGSSQEPRASPRGFFFRRTPDADDPR